MAYLKKSFWFAALFYFSHVSIVCVLILLHACNDPPCPFHILQRAPLAYPTIKFGGSLQYKAGPRVQSKVAGRLNLLGYNHLAPAVAYYAEKPGLPLALLLVKPLPPQYKLCDKSGIWVCYVSP